MSAEGFYLFTSWSLQAIAYSIVVYGAVSWKIRKRIIFMTAVGLCLIGPWLFPVEGGYNVETGEYVCGLAALLPLSIFWGIGNFGNLVLILFFAGLGRIWNQQGVD